MCKDASLSYLNNLGYNVVRHPRADIAPLDIVGRQNRTVARLGKLNKLVALNLATDPILQQDIPATGMNGRTSDGLGADAALSVLGGFISAMGGNAGVTAHLKSAQKIQFVYSDVLCDSVEAADIGSYLTANGVNQTNILWQQYRLGNGRLFVITDVVKSRKFSIVIEGTGKADLAIDVPAIKQMLSGKVNVSGESGSLTTLTFEGARPLVFGFKCFEIRLSNGQIALLSTPPSGPMAFADDGEPPEFLAKEQGISPSNNEGGFLIASDLLEFSEKAGSE